MLLSDDTFRKGYADILLDEIESHWQQEFNAFKLPTKQQDPLGYLDRFAFKLPVLIEGDKGSGKSYEVHEYAKKHSLHEVFIGGHAGVESIDLLGHLVPAVVENKSYSLDALTNGFEPAQTQMLWKDGALTAAFRKAASGEKTILILDELLRIPQRELNILLSALTPLDGRYILRTGRVVSVTNGIANEEVLYAPIDKIFIVATTNIGGSFAIDDIDPALAERFMVIRKDTTEARLMEILKIYSDEKGNEGILASKLTEFYSKMKTAKREGFINNMPTTRTLSRAIQLSLDEGDVWELVRQQRLLWVGRDMDGFPVEEQMKQIDVIINQAAAMT